MSKSKLSYKKEAPKIYRHNEESKKREQHPNKDQLPCSLSWGQLLEYPYMSIWLGILCWNCCIWWNGLCRLNCCIWWNGLCRLNCCMGCACRISWGCVAKFGGGGTQLSWSMRGVTIVLMSSKVMSWMLFLFLSFFGLFLRLKYFWAWLATWNGFFDGTNFCKIYVQLFFPTFSSPRRNEMCCYLVQCEYSCLDWLLSFEGIFLVDRMRCVLVAVECSRTTSGFCGLWFICLL